MSATACTQPGCTGSYVDGWCDVCGSPQTPSPSPATGNAAAAGSSATTPARPASGTPSAPRIPDGTHCRQPGCTGRYLDGYCDVCGSSADSDPVVAQPDPVSTQSSPVAAGPESERTVASSSRRLASTALGSARARSAGSLATRRVGTGSTRLRSQRLGQGLTTIPPVPEIDAEKALMADPVVPEDKRFCSNCGTAVGRGHDGKPGRTTGFCPKCRQEFSFDPKLVKGDLVAGQYEVAGCLAHGGLGWIYLARDRNVSDRWVVLKGLLNSGDPDALAAAIAEQRFLAQVNHPHIVEIYNFVTHDDAGYIVMEYVGGTSLKSMLKQRMRKAGRYDALPVDQALAYIIELMPAFQYLHDLGLVYCDFKPDNVIQVGDDLKLIDMGGVRRIDDDDSAIFGTVGYQAPEVAETGPTVASDIYTIGRTLVVLTMEFRGYQSTYVKSLPAVEDTPVFQRYDSFYRLLDKACAPSPDDRFTSADELRVQMLGVLREVVAQDHPDRAIGSAASLLFQEPAVSSDTLDWDSLPDLRRDPSDPQAGWLHGLVGDSPDDLIAKLGRAPEATPEVLIAMARTGIEAGRDQVVSDATGAMLAKDPWEWRAVWMQGLAQLRAGQSVEAQSSFNAVYGQVPGELAPKLALALACERGGQSELAESLYAVCARTDANYTPAAAFGMARVRANRKDVVGAVEALDRIPATSRAYSVARQARATLLARMGTGLPALEDSLRSVDRVLMDPRDRALLQVTVFERALNEVAPGSGAPRSGAAKNAAANPAGTAAPAAPPAVPAVDGRPTTVAGMREGLEDALRNLARLTPDRSQRIRLIDRANEMRPWSAR